MTEQELHELLDAETDAAEATRDAPISPGARRRGGARSQVYSLRLTPDQITSIESAAAELGAPATVLVRDWVLAGLAAHRGPGTDLQALVEDLRLDVERLSRRVQAAG